MDAADTDWCLSCGQHVDGAAPYCSAECLNRDRPLSSPPALPLTPSSLHTLSDTDNSADIIYHEVQDQPKGLWAGSDRAGIQAWAAAIPSGSSDGTLSSDVSRASSRAPSPPPMRTPRLLLNHRRPVAPSLCMSTPQPACPQPSRPILTPLQSIASLNLAKTPGEVGSMSMTSLISGITDSFVATPSSASGADPISDHEHYNKPSMMFEALATHVRSWVSPSPQLKCAPSALPKPHPERAQIAPHNDNDDDDTWPASDEHPAHDVWWASEGSMVRRKKSSAVKRKPLENMQPQSAMRDDHPAYRSRGRKVSRPFA